MWWQGDLAQRLEAALASGSCGKCARLEQDLARSEARRRQLEEVNRDQAVRIAGLERQLRQVPLQLQGSPAAAAALGGS